MKKQYSILQRRIVMKSSREMNPKISYMNQTSMSSRRNAFEQTRTSSGLKSTKRSFSSSLREGLQNAIKEKAMDRYEAMMRSNATQDISLGVEAADEISRLLGARKVGHVSNIKQKIRNKFHGENMQTTLNTYHNINVNNNTLNNNTPTTINNITINQTLLQKLQFIRDQDTQQRITSKYIPVSQDKSNCSQVKSSLKTTKINQKVKQIKKIKQKSFPQDAQEIQEIVLTKDMPKLTSSQQQYKQLISDNKPLIQNVPLVDNKPLIYDRPLPIDVPLRESLPQECSESSIEQLFYYIDCIQILGEFRYKSKGYSSVESKLSTYYITLHFCWKMKELHSALKSRSAYLSLSMDEMRTIVPLPEVQAEITKLQQHQKVGQSLLKQAYEGVRGMVGEMGVLRDAYRDGVRALKEEFKSVYGSKNMWERCCYLIQTYCNLKTLENEEIKDYEEVEGIKNLKGHVEKYKVFME